MFDKRPSTDYDSLVYNEFEQDITKRQVFMSQRKYMDVMLRRFGMIDCKPAMTPIETKYNLKRLEVADQHDMNSNSGDGNFNRRWTSPSSFTSSSGGIFIRRWTPHLHSPFTSSSGNRILNRRWTTYLFNNSSIIPITIIIITTIHHRQIIWLKQHQNTPHH
ncbi:hypothetical protein ACLKA6_016287 [Drosophila palustris]